MAKIADGEKVYPLKLPQLDGNVFDLNELQGTRYLLSFYRFASCPLCNLRVHEIVNDSVNWPEGFTAVAVFDSPLANLQKHASRHDAPFPILADENNVYYHKFGVEASWLKTLKGAFTRLPRILYSMIIKGYWPVGFKGKLHTMPLDILVNENGIVDTVYYAKDEGDHIPMQQVRDFYADVAPVTQPVSG